MKPKSKILKKALMYMVALNTSLAMFLSALSPQALVAVWMATDIRFLRQAMTTLGVKAAMLQLIPDVLRFMFQQRMTEL